ncbi:MAG: D-alanyl-D-alanine carboxypeptidase family protein [Eubacteriales bacterium]
MKRTIYSLLILFCCIFPSKAVSLSAQSAILIEMESGRVLYEKNIDETSLIASITKLMTALVALESDILLEEMVAIPPEACGVEGSSLYLTKDTEISLEGLLYGLMLHSGNDAAVAIAITCAGSEEAFVAQMNEKAKELGMTNTLFANPHGLNADNHYSTARDMATLAQACLANETLSQIVATKEIRVDNRYFSNKNKLLWQYEGCIGMKTGYTQLAGRTLVSASTKDGMTLICVTLDDPDDWLDHKNLFDYGFAHYEMKTLCDTETVLGTVPLSGSLSPFVTVTAQESLRYPVAEGEEIVAELVLPEEAVWAPVSKGEHAGGQLAWYLGDDLCGEMPCVYGESFHNIVTEKQSFFDQFKSFFQ